MTPSRKFHRMEYNAVLSETTILDPRFTKLAFNDNRAVDEAVHRVTAAAAVSCSPSSQPAPPPGGQEGEQGAGEQEVEPQMLFGGLFDEFLYQTCK